MYGGLAILTMLIHDPAYLSIVRMAIPSSAILLPAGFFFSVASPGATAPNQLIDLCYVGAAVLALGVLILGIGLVRRPRVSVGEARPQ